MAIHGFPGGVISATPPTISPSGASGVWTLDEQLQAGANWPVAPAFLSNSVRLRASANAYLTRTPATSTNRRTFTFSAWIKRGKLSATLESPHLIRVNANVETAFRFEEDNTLRFFANPGVPSINVVTTQVFRDPSSWYHLVLAVDTTQATASNRVKMYVNGSQITAFNASIYPTQNYETGFNQAVAHGIGATPSGGENYDGYLTDINFIDGQALTPNYFGAVDAATGVWEPATYRGTYGTNGFYLPMNITQDLVFVDYLIVAGGGGAICGGGGGGGRLTSSSTLTVGTTYAITVGAGGNGGSQGSSSVFNSITATGGGFGAAAGGNIGGSGGSGGGGGHANNTTSYAGGSGTGGQGNNGGNGFNQGSGGGGGAGGAGSNGTNSGGGASGGIGGNGGAGSASSITGSSVTYAGGGGGGSFDVSGGSGGSGGGGAGRRFSDGAGVNGTANLGGGGGGAGNGSGGAGGSGVVILRIPTADYSGVTTGSPTVTTDGSFTVVRYTSSGTYRA